MSSGAEGVSDDDARRAIASGHRFVPEVTSGLFHRNAGHSYGLSSHLFYRESALFIASLHDHDAARFRQFLLSVEDGATLESAFDAAFAESVASAWADFVRSAGFVLPHSDISTWTRSGAGAQASTPRRGRPSTFA